MNDVVLADVIPAIQFVESADGRRLAVMDADDWDNLIAWFEDIEDQRIIAANLERLRAGPAASGAIPLESALDEL